MRQFIALIILLAFVMQTFSSAFIVLDYYVNTGSFAKDCVNKARPMMHCNGKCQMMKKIKEQEKKEQEETEKKAESKNEVLSTKSFFATVPTQYLIVIKSKKLLPYSDGKSISRSLDIFHPPKA